MLPLLLALSALAADPYVQVLGIAQDGGHPHPGCDRSCCAGLAEGAGHHVASLGIVEGDRHWLLDATPDFPRQEAGLPGTLAGILLTHAHIGHYTGLMYLGREAMGAKGVAVWAMPRMRSFLEGNGPWDQLVRLGNIALADLKDGESVALSPTLHVRAFAVPHRDEYSETVGFVVEGPTRRVAWLPDIDKWERWAQPVETLLAEVDRAWLDGTFFDASELPGREMSEIPHPFIVESIERFSPLDPSLRDRVHFVHLNHSNPAMDPESAAAERIRAAGLHLAAEGDRFTL